MRWRECKPINYNYLTLSLEQKFNANDCRQELILTLEKLLYNSLLKLPPAEQREHIDYISYFEGKSSSVIRVILSKLETRKVSTSFLVKYNRIKFN